LRRLATFDQVDEAAIVCDSADQCLAAVFQWVAAAFAASLFSTTSASTATPVLGLIRNGLTSIEAIRPPASEIRLDSPTSALTAEAWCSAGLPRGR